VVADQGPEGHDPERLGFGQLAEGGRGFAVADLVEETLGGQALHERLGHFDQVR
jgi:hypothetical protein